MKITISVHIPEKAAILVKEGDLVDTETPLAELAKTSDTLQIELSKILNISPKKITKYIKKNIGDNLIEGEIIAEKKSFLSSVVVRSPHPGKVEGFDLSVGTVTYRVESQEKRNIYPAMKGKIKTVSGNVIEIECIAKSYDTLGGSGSKVSGTLRYIKGESVGVLEVLGEMEKSIILIHEVTDAGIAKMDALGALGLICSKTNSLDGFPTVCVDKHIFHKMVEEEGKEVIIDPSSKKIYIPE